MTALAIPEEIKQEFTVNDQGQAFCSRRGVARLCGLKSNSPISNLLKNLADQKLPSKALQNFTEQDFQADQELPSNL